MLSTLCAFSILLCLPISCVHTFLRDFVCLYKIVQYLLVRKKKMKKKEYQTWILNHFLRCSREAMMNNNDRNHFDSYQKKFFYVKIFHLVRAKIEGKKAFLADRKIWHDWLHFVAHNIFHIFFARESGEGKQMPCSSKINSFVFIRWSHFPIK